MKPYTLFSSALLVALSAACTTPQADRTEPSAEVPCRCGTPLGDMEGCAHADCRAGRSNPDNPDCVCGTLEIPAAEE